MALPLSTNQLIAHLRSSFVAIDDEQDIGHRIMKPYLHDDVSQDIVQLKPFLLESPPITFDIARHISKSYQRLDNYQNRRHTQKNTVAHKKNKKRREKAKLSKKITSNERGAKPSKPKRISLELEAVAEQDNNDPVDVKPPPPTDNEKLRSIGLSYTKTITGKTKKSITPSITYLFRGTRKEPDDRNLELIEEEHNLGSEDSNDDGDLNAKLADLEEEDDEVGSVGSPKLSDDPVENTEDDLLSIDSDFGVPVNSKGQVVRQVNVRGDSGKKARRMKRNSSSQIISSPTEANTTIDTLDYDPRDLNSDGDVENDDENGEDDEDDDEQDEYDDDEDDEDEYDDDEDDDDDDEIDTSSTDSAFTDIEAGSILDDSILLDSFNNSFAFENQNGFHVKSKKKRSSSSSGGSYRKSLSSNGLQLPSNTFKPNVNPLNASMDVSNDIIGTQSARRASLPLIKKNPAPTTLHFNKIEPPVKSEASGSHNSNLTSLIHSKYKSININPLSYFSFANSKIPEDTVDKNYIKKLHLNIFIPPQRTPTLTSMEINNNSSVLDCIGYILLQLHQSPSGEEFIKTYPTVDDMNPNSWRIEMVDEDGENYGSFGILDRARLLSSYNNITDIALCKVTNSKEIERNMGQTPLSPEFILNLKKRSDMDTLFLAQKQVVLPVEVDVSDRIELQVFHSKKNNTNGELNGDRTSTMIIIPLNSTISQALREYTTKAGINSDKYKFREIKRYQSLLQEPTANFLKEDDLVKNLETKMVELVPFESGLAPTTFGDEFAITAPADGGLDGITPSKPYDLSFTEKKLLADKENEKERFQSVGSTKPSQLTRKDSTSKITKKIANLKVGEKQKSSSAPSKYLDNSRLLSSSLIYLPTNLNSIYFKWKVWRKKTTILNKIEKSLVIDGDYIHLTPSDDAIFKKNPSGSPGISNNTAVTGTHHHFHHYNYSNYYNNLMMKTTSFHVTQIVKLKQYKHSKNPTHFKIVTEKIAENGKVPNKRYDLEAVDVAECDQIILKIKWVQQVYKNNMNL